MTQWEYRLEHFVNPDMLNELGRDGWGLVTADLHIPLALLKRSSVARSAVRSASTERVEPEAILVPAGMTKEDALAVVNAPVVEPTPAPLAMPPTMAAARARFAEMTAKRNGTAPRPPVELEVDCVLDSAEDVATKLDVSVYNVPTGKRFLVIDASNGRAPGVWEFTKPIDTNSVVGAGGASGGGGTFVQAKRVADPYVGQSIRVKSGLWEGTIWDATGPGGYVRRKG